jgi:hypothetical protein
MPERPQGQKRGADVIGNYGEKAAEFRKQAAESNTPLIKKQLLDIAVQYEMLATEVEEIDRIRSGILKQNGI